MTRAALAVLACTGCSQIFGLDDPSRAGAGDARVDDGPPMDVAGDVRTGARVRRIDFDDDKVTGGPHASFPVLVDISATWLRTTGAGGDVASPDGIDIWFSADQGGSSIIDHETERYGGAEGRYTGWLRIPSFSGASFVYMHYGDPSITQSKENPPEVWFNGYVFVTHMNGVVTDSTGGSSSLASMNTAASTGLFGGAITFNGTDSLINAGSADVIDNAFDGGGTIEAWVRPVGFGEGLWGRVVDKGGDNGWLLYMNDNNNNDSFSFAYGSNNATFGQWTSPAGSIVLDAWQHLAVTFDRTTSTNVPQLYVNGAAVSYTVHSTPSGAFDTDVQRTMYIGDAEGGGRAFDGQIDEVRLSDAVRSPAWIATEYANQSSPSTFYTVSGEL